MSRLNKRADQLIAAAVLVLAARVAYLFARYVLGAGTQRFHVESAALIFVALGLLLRLARSRMTTSAADDRHFAPAWLGPAYCALALGLYWRALSIGLLSDDFVLVDHAAAWRIGPITEVLFRPIPLFAWAVLIHAGGGATLLHLLNVLLHGTNAYLVARLAAGLGADLVWSGVAGLLLLTAPLAPEAVVWLSGVFDLSATAFVLLCILAARRYGSNPSAGTRVQLIACGVAALFSKETAAVAGGLVLVDAWARKALTRRLVGDCAILLGVAAIIAAVRLAGAFGATPPPVDKYLVQRALFGTFGALAVPWHVDLTTRAPWLSIMGVAIVVALSAAFFVNSKPSSQPTRIAIGGIISVLLPILPIFPILFIAPDLQQARYLYMSAFGWIVLITNAATDRTRRLAPLLLIVGLIALNAVATVRHLEPWREAASLRDKVETSAAASGMDTCPSVTVTNLPDSIDGAYVFRNGGREAFAQDLHLDATVTDVRVPGPCSFRWDEGRLSFVRSAVE